MTTGSARRSSHAVEYSVSTLGRTTERNDGLPRIGMWRKRFGVASADTGSAKNRSRVRSMITSGSAYSAACSARVSASGAADGGAGATGAGGAQARAPRTAGARSHGRRVTRLRYHGSRRRRRSALAQEVVRGAARDVVPRAIGLHLGALLVVVLATVLVVGHAGLPVRVADRRRGGVPVPALRRRRGHVVLAQADPGAVS